MWKKPIRDTLGSQTSYFLFASMSTSIISLYLWCIADRDTSESFSMERRPWWSHHANVNAVFWLTSVSWLPQRCKLYLMIMITKWLFDRFLGVFEHNYRPRNTHAHTKSHWVVYTAKDECNVCYAELKGEASHLETAIKITTSCLCGPLARHE